MLNNQVIEFDVDINKDSYIIGTCMQGNKNSITLVLNLYSNGTAYPVQTGENISYMLEGCRPDNMGIQCSVSNISDNVITFENISKNVTDVAGIVELTLSIYETGVSIEKKLILKNKFYLNVLENPYYENEQHIIDVSDTTTIAPHVLEGDYFYTAAGVKTVGTMKNNEVYTETLGSYLSDNKLHSKIPIGAYLSEVGSGYSEVVTEQSDIVNAIGLNENNIVKGVEICGVVGKYNGVVIDDTTAIPSHVLETDYFYMADGTRVKGTIPVIPNGLQAPNGWIDAGNLNMGVHFPNGAYLEQDPWVWIPVSWVRDQYGITQDKIVKGQSICGVSGIGGEGIDISDTTAIAQHVVAGEKFHDANGTLVEGTMVNRPAWVGSNTAWLDINSFSYCMTIPTGAYLEETLTGYTTIYSPKEHLWASCGITADKIVTGQSIAGVNGTGGGTGKYASGSFTVTQITSIGSRWTKLPNASCQNDYETNIYVCQINTYLDWTPTFAKITYTAVPKSGGTSIPVCILLLKDSVTNTCISHGSGSYERSIAGNGTKWINGNVLTIPLHNGNSDYYDLTAATWEAWGN